jgi:iron complex outermembrane receptor protein
MDASDVYRTSTDEVQYGGKMAFAGIFLQDEFRLFKKLSVIAGLRFDMAYSFDGYLRVDDPTSNTGFIQEISDEFENESWYQLSPKLAVQYQIDEKLGAYVSVSTGFMPPKIDDLSKSGKISKGFKLANPQLKPESISNYELGLTWMLMEKFSLEPSAYYSRGHDFQYFVATGDSVDTGGTDLKPVLQRQNISDVEILGAELTATWEVISNVVLTGNCSMNASKILSFNDPSNEDKDLTGKSLIEVPIFEAYASVSWYNRIVNVIFDWQYTGKEWYDDENTQYIPPYNLFGIKLTKTLKQGIGFTLTAQNIFDHVTLDRKGTLSPGRFVIGEISYAF